MDSEKIRLLIADDHPLYRDGIHGLLDSVPDTEVVGEAATGEEAITLAESLQPDVIGVTDGLAAFDAAARHPHGETVVVMIAPLATLRFG